MGAEDELPPRATPAAPRTEPRRRRPVPRFAWAVGAMAVAAATVLVIVVAVGVPAVHPKPAPVSVAALTDVSGAVSIDPAVPVRLRFTRPMSHTSTAAALHLTPALAVRSQWQGDTLVVSPDHGFAPNSVHLLTIDHRVARTATGAPLQSDIRVAFGTAAVAGAGRRSTAPVPLSPTVVANADDGSEAVVTRNGALLLTSARPSQATDHHTGLVRLENGTAFKISNGTAAICVSRTAESIAFLEPDGGGVDVVFASSVGTPQQHVAVNLDPGSPLGWIGDSEVVYVGGGRLRAVNRDGVSRLLAGTSVDTANDGIVISSGGRYAYLRHGADSQVVDLQTGAGHPLPGIVGDPAFSADGASVVWVDTAGGTPRVAVAASGGGPVRTSPLPVQPKDVLSDLSVAPDGAHLVYSVTHPDQHAELRLAALPDGDTLAVSTDGAGESPNWSPSGRFFTVLGHGAAGPDIETVPVPASIDDPQADLEAAAAAFANAQVSGDSGAQLTLAAPGAALPPPPQVTRAAVVWVSVSADGTAVARVRLTRDARPDDLVVRQVEETLTLGPAADRPVLLRAVSIGSLAPAPAGPRLIHADTDAVPGAVLMTFDSDLDPRSVASAFAPAAPGAGALPATYDAATRTVTLRPAAAAGTNLVIRIGTGLRDISGTAPAAAVDVPVRLAG